MAKPGKWAQCELKLAAGAEAWVIVRHRRGWFRLPAGASVQELLLGVAEGWAERPRSTARAQATVRIPLEQYRAIEPRLRELGY